MKKHHLLAVVTVLLFVVTALLAIIFLPPHLVAITKFTIDHPLLAPLILIFWKAIGVVIPPIPSGVLSLALIPVIGWFPSFLYSTIGALLGAVIAFYLARLFREPLVKRFVPLQDLQQWEGKMTGNREFWTFTLIRLTTGPIMEYISYIAGLSKLGFGKYFIATLLSLLPSILVFYVGEAAYTKLSQKSPFVVVGFLLSLGVLYLVYKHYEKKRKSKRK
jgi:uncharacterized membrane protein YdjX (TVP38/TMEM64 family)